MNFKYWMGFKDPQKARTFRLDRIDLFDTGEPLMRLYDDAILVAQDGLRDNVSKRMRYTALTQVAEQAMRSLPDADLIECGCLFGHSTHMLAQIMQRQQHRGMLHVFDSFEGLSNFNPEDHSAATPDEESRKKKQKHFVADFERVSTSLKKYPFVRLYKGWIPSRFEEISDGRFCFASIDVDLFQPTLDSLAFIYPRLLKGGMVYLDDYGYKDFPGARKAVDLYLGDKERSLFLRLPSGAAILVK